MKLLVTGASGFLGRHVVAEALRRGHEVRAMLRPASDACHRESGIPRLEIVRVDLRSTAFLANAIAGVDAVLHLAAAKSGDIYTQYAGTVVATENLLAAMEAAAVRHIVAISSMAIYDYRKIRTLSQLDESSPIERDAFDRDAYAHTKLVQERLVRSHASRHGWHYTILRPGAIYGRDNLFTARAGIRVNDRLFIRTGGWAKVPLSYVENCAEAVILAAERGTSGETLNVVDDDQPTQRRYVTELRGRLTVPPRVVPIPWTALRCAAGLAAVVNRLLLGDRARIPGLLIPARLDARCKPLYYSNRKIKEELDWRPRYSLEEALQRSFATLPDAPVDRIQTPEAMPMARKAAA